MANYTITTYTASETGTDSMSSANIATPELIITPNPGYVIRANDFSIHNATRGTGADINKWTGGDIPSSIASVTFVDQDNNYTIGLGYSNSNTIKAIVTFASNFAISNQNHNISLDIDGEAHLPQDVALSIPINFDLLFSLTGVNYGISNLASGLSWTSDGNALSGNSQAGSSNIGGTIEVTPEQQQGGEFEIAEIAFEGEETQSTGSEVPEEEQTTVLEEVTIEEVVEEEEDPTTVDDNTLIPEQPGGGTIPIFTGGGGGTHLGPHQQVTPLGMTPKTIENDEEEQLPHIGRYGLMLNVDSASRSVGKTTFSFRAVAATPPAISSTKVIKSVDFGKSEINIRGEQRVMKVYGDIGAKVNVGVYTDTGTIGTIDGVESADIAVAPGILTSSTTSARGQGVYSFTVTFPSTSTTKNYGLKISPFDSGTSLGSNINQGGSSSIYDYTFVQYANPVITITASQTDTSHGSSYNSQLAGLTITKVGTANTVGSALNHVKNRTEDITIDWTLNSVGGTISNAKPLILDNDIITDGGFEEGLTNWTTSVTGNNLVLPVVDATYGDYIERTGSDSNTVSLTQANALVIGRAYTFVLEYSGQTKAGGEITIKAGTASSGAQSLTVDSVNVRKKIVTTLTCAGNRNLIIELNNDTTARVHSIATSLFTNSIPSENGGTDIMLVKSSTVIDGTTVKITGSLIVNKYGNANVNMDVDVAQLFTTS